MLSASIYNKNSSKRIDRECSSGVDNLVGKKPAEKGLGNQILNFSYPLRRSLSLSDLSKQPSHQHISTGRVSSLPKKKQFRSASFSSSSLLQFNGSKVELLRRQTNKTAVKHSVLKSRSFTSRAEAKLPQFVCSNDPSSIRSLFLHNLQLKLHLITLLPGASKLRMGQTLSEPVTKKETSSDENHTLKVGASCMQGWRISILF